MRRDNERRGRRGNKQKKDQIARTQCKCGMQKDVKEREGGVRRRNNRIAVSTDVQEVTVCDVDIRWNRYCSRILSAQENN